jgi:poly(hydroxyalkanoate) depolymerase family esterase
MTKNLQGLMREATQLTQSGRLKEATALIQSALTQGAGRATESANSAVAPHQSEVLEGCVFEVESQVEVAHSPVAAPSGRARNPFESPRGFSGQAATLRDTFTGGQFVSDSQSHHYKLYTPPQQATEALLPMVLMLHGCTQNPDDFSVGTAMNVLARGTADSPAFYVLYPSQTRASNAQGCWNWFDRAHQRRGQGEPAWIAELTQQLVRTLPIDKRRVYVAGLSAGGAMAAIVASAYPDVFAAAGVHSGLPVGAARNLTEALTAMKHGAVASTTSSRAVPTIVFHGDQDRTVHARNAQGLVHAVTADGLWDETTDSGVSAGGRRHTRTAHARDGKSHAEHWELHGAGHAWSGGNPAGSYADPKGVNATTEMMKFFLQHRLPE